MSNVVALTGDVGDKRDVIVNCIYAIHEEFPETDSESRVAFSWDFDDSYSVIFVWSRDAEARSAAVHRLQQTLPVPFVVAPAADLLQDAPLCLTILS